MSAAVQMPVHVLYHDPQRRAGETDTERSPQSQLPGFVMVSPRYPMPRAQQRAPSTADRPHRPHLRHHNRHRGSIILHPQPQIPRRNRHSGPITHTEGATTCTLDHDYPATRPPGEGYPPQHIRGNRLIPRHARRRGSGRGRSGPARCAPARNPCATRRHVAPRPA